MTLASELKICLKINSQKVAIHNDLVGYLEGQKSYQKLIGLWIINHSFLSKNQESGDLRKPSVCPWSPH